uniref:Coronin n=1 Tax=Callorhinchus milii TaxID=7868 RepID=A0A4W3HLK2_CALMI|eukprot:gi/632952444/ref/XP_007891855.1/ PREDICTED: coronin-7 isoform X2 [Callorhinchus milii]
MNRFRVSKFRNTAAQVPPRAAWITDIRAAPAPSCSNHIKSSSTLIAFSTSNPGSLGIVPLENGNREQQLVSELPCHGDAVTDFDFCPFDDWLLATCSADETVKLWRFSGSSAKSEAVVTLGPEAVRIECVLFHPAADGVLTTGAGNTAKVWDLTRQKAFVALEDHGDQIQSLCWKQDGSLLGSSCKDKKLRIFDPRASSLAVQSIEGHKTNKDSRVIWLSSTENIISTGFSQLREREVKLWDTRKFTSSISTLTLDSAQGVLMPLFDADTGLLILSGKGDSFLHCYEVSAAQAAITQVNQCLMEAKSKGAALVPKLILDVMACEVLRVLQLTENCIIPVTYTVPRKSQKEFHEDLFPDTVGAIPAMAAQDWWSGSNKEVPKVCLNPGKRTNQSFSSIAVPGPRGPPEETVRPVVGEPGPKEQPLQSNQSPSSSPLTSPSMTSLSSTSGKSSGFVTSPQSQKSLHSLFGSSSKFRHVQGLVSHRDTHITNLKGLNLTIPGECDGFCVNRERAAIPLSISGGQIAVLELSKHGRLPDGAIPTIQNTAAVVDMSWDPFDCSRLAVAGEDAKIRVWRIPDGGLTEIISKPETVLPGHPEKIYSIKFHPLAADILASSSHDMTVKIWNLDTGKMVIELKGHKDQIFSLCWSPNGQFLSTVCRDGKIRIYDPRRSVSPLQEGPGPERNRGARILWVCGGQYLLVSGFNSLSERQVYLYKAEALSAGVVATASLDMAPSTLIPFYDEDTRTVFLTGKGDTKVCIFEIQTENPHFLECSTFCSADLHKGFGFLPKTECNVREVEFARAWRLSHSSLEMVLFSVPRVKKEFFQDDIFPETSVWWKFALSASAWLSGSNQQHQKISLQPSNMTPVSAAPKEAPVRKYPTSAFYLEEKTDDQKKEELLSAMVAKLGNLDDPLPQDAFEGVDEEEWDE